MTTLQSTTLHLTILQLHFIDIQNDHAVCCSHMFTPDAHKHIAYTRKTARTDFKLADGCCVLASCMLLTSNELKCTVEHLGSFGLPNFDIVDIDSITVMICTRLNQKEQGIPRKYC